MINQIYIIESILATGVLYIIYLLALRNRPMLVFNRFMLLGMVVLGVSLPLINFTLPGNSAIPTSSILVDEVMINLEKESILILNLFKWSTLYFAVMVLFLINFIIQAVHLIRLGKSSKETNQYKLINGKYPHFSFFNQIFINNSLLQSESDLISVFEHEKVHVQQKHSFDILVFEVLKIIFWFNPFIWLLKKCAIENHEYLADKGMLETTSKSTHEYFYELLQTSLFTYKISLVNNFNHSLLKKRIMMMTRQNLKTVERFIPLFIAPALIIVAAFFACTDNVESKELKSDNEEVVVKQGEKIYTEVDVMPLFEGESFQNFRNHIQKNLKYPEEAATSAIQGKVFVQFVVSSTGEVTNAEVVRGVDPLLDAEALRVIKESPKWTPGMNDEKNVAVQFTFPIAFALK